MSSRKRGRRSDLVDDSDDDDARDSAVASSSLAALPPKIVGGGRESLPAGAASGAGSEDEAAAAGRTLQAVNASDQDRIVAGMVERIELVNFLVHSKFSIDLHRHCNFIVGRNGSGKSSIMGAIMVAFGAPAGKVRSKAKSYTEFIKRGTRTAQVTVTINNTGDDAFYPGAYGNKIIITRKLHDTGHVDLQVSGVKRLPEGGFHRATRPKDELRAIMSDLSIPIETPAVSMTQDDMKTKLASSNPAKLYQMFLEVTGLKQSWESIVTTVTEIKSTSKAYKACEDELQQRKDAMDKTKRLCEGIEKFSLMEGEIEDASRVVDVANMIQSHEKEIAAASAQVADQEKRKKALTERVEKVFQDVDKLNVDFMALQQKAEENASQFTSNTHALGQLSSQSGELQQRIHVVQTKVADKQLEVDEASKSVLVTKEQIQAAEAEVKASTEYDEQMQQFEAELQARVAEIREIHKSSVAAGMEEVEAIDQSAAADRTLQILRNEAAELQGEVAKAQQALQDLEDRAAGRVSNPGASRGAAMRAHAQSSSDPRLGGFKSQVKACYYAIQSNKDKFKVLPVGPLGMEVSVDDKHSKWTSAVEGILSHNCSIFLVNDRADADVLSSILPQSGVTYSIYPRSAVSKIDFTQAVDSQSLAAITQIKDDWARAFIYDNTVLLQSLRVQDDAEALNIADKGLNPPNLPWVVSHTTRRKMEGTGLRAMTLPRAQGMVQVSLASRIKQSKQGLEQLMAQQQIVLGRQADADKAVKQATLTKRKCQGALDAVRQQLGSKKTALEAFEAMEKPKQPEKVQEMQDKIDSLKSRLMGRQATLQKSQDTAAALAAKLRELTAQLQTCEAEQKRISKACDAIKKGAVEEQMAKKNERIQEMTAKSDKIIEKLTEAEADLNAAKLDVAQARAALDEELHEYQSSVQWDSDRMEVAKDATVAQAQQQLEVLRLRRDDLQQKMEQEGVDLQTLHEELSKKEAEYKAVYTKFNSLAEILQSLRLQTAQRRDAWNRVRARGTAKMASSFTSYMRRKGHFGTIQFRADSEHGDPTIGDMVVQVAPDVHSRRDTNVAELTQAVDASQSESVQSSSYADLGSLSGGEKSFAMVSLLSALWDAVDVPFAMLDEFDVFMDEATRRSAMVALLRNAREFRGSRQFIFITPHDISSAVQGSDDFVQVFRLRAVEPLEFE